MQGRPEDTDLCAFCAGDEPRPSDTPQQRTTFYKGYYTNHEDHEAARREPGQGYID